MLYVCMLLYLVPAQEILRTRAKQATQQTEIMEAGEAKIELLVFPVHTAI